MTRTYIAIAGLLGSIIGAGFLGIPYMINKSGFFPGIALLILLSLIIMLIMLYLGEIALRTKTPHHLPGYAERYLGKTGKHLMFFAVIFGIFSALIAYLIAEGQLLSQIFFNSQDYSLQLSILFWFLLSLISFFGMKAFKRGEEIGVSLLLIFLAIITILHYQNINLENLSKVSISNILAPFGVILFSLLGFTALPEVLQILGNEKNNLKKSVILAYLLCFTVYLFFAFLVIGISGSSTPEIATLALGLPFILISIITMTNAYLANSIALIDTFRFDYRKRKRTAWLITIILPMVIIILLDFLGKAEFTKILSIGGLISGGITAILILFMHKHAKEKGNRIPEYSLPHSQSISIVLFILFIIATIFEIVSLIS